MLLDKKSHTYLAVIVGFVVLFMTTLSRANQYYTVISGLREVAGAAPSAASSNYWSGLDDPNDESFSDGSWASVAQATSPPPDDNYGRGRQTTNVGLNSPYDYGLGGQFSAVSHNTGSGVSALACEVFIEENCKATMFYFNAYAAIFGDNSVAYMNVIVEDEDDDNAVVYEKNLLNSELIEEEYDYFGLTEEHTYRITIQFATSSTEGEGASAGAEFMSLCFSAPN